MVLRFLDLVDSIMTLPDYIPGLWYIDCDYQWFHFLLPSWMMISNELLQYMNLILWYIDWSTNDHDILIIDDDFLWQPTYRNLHREVDQSKGTAQKNANYRKSCGTWTSPHTNPQQCSPLGPEYACAARAQLGGVFCWDPRNRGPNGKDNPAHEVVEISLLTLPSSHLLSLHLVGSLLAESHPRDSDWMVYW